MIDYLFHRYEKDNIKIRDYWDSDECAIGITDESEKYLIYISTIGLEESGYFVALENSAESNHSLPYIAAGEFNNLGLAELEELFVNHLRIKR